MSEVKVAAPDMVVGELYVLENEKSPNPRKFVGTEARYCSLHGDRIGTSYLFVKKRNSTLRPWGGVTEVRGAETVGVPYESA